MATVMQSENAGISGATIEPTIGQMYQACLAFRVEKKQGAEGSNGELTQDEIQDAVDRVNRMAFLFYSHPHWGAAANVLRVTAVACGAFVVIPLCASSHWARQQMAHDRAFDVECRRRPSLVVLTYRLHSVLYGQCPQQCSLSPTLSTCIL
jgi:hypothetical protein